LDQELIPTQLVLIVGGQHSSKKAKAPSFQARLGWNVAPLFF